MAARDAAAPRLDRWLTLAVAAPLAGALRTRRGGAVPILMYHSVSEPDDRAAHPYFRTVTGPAAFARQLRWLQANGWRGVGLAEALRPADGGGDARRVVLTFDDGFRDFRTAAWPLLASAGFGATVFLPTAFLGTAFPTGRDCLAAAEVRELAAQGVEFGSHSVTHRHLAALAPAALAAELRDSKHAIEDITGRRVDTYSHPYRFPEEDRDFVRRLGDQLDAHGYRAGVTTTIGRWRAGADQRFLPRLPVNDDDDALLLAAKLDGHYDWLRAAQRLVKRSRALLRRRRTA